MYIHTHIYIYRERDTRARRSKGVIWFGESSPKEGDRIIAWYKSEWELGLSWDSTLGYPGVESNLAKITPPDLRERVLKSSEGFRISENSSAV